MNSIIIGAIDGYDWKQVETWWKSIKLTGFTGDIHMLCYEISTQTIHDLQDHGIIVHLCSKKHGQVVVDRFNDFETLSKTIDANTWCICTDVNDLVFQYDPDFFFSTYLPDNYEIVVAGEGILHKGNRWVRQNAASSFPQYWSVMANKVLYNAGSFAAQAKTLEDLARRVFRLCMTVPEARNHDQYALNILLQTQPEFTNWTYFENASGVWCFSGASSVFAKSEDRENFMDFLPIIESGICRNHRGELYCMFHHWNRDITVMQEVISQIRYQWQQFEATK